VTKPDARWLHATAPPKVPPEAPRPPSRLASGLALAQSAAALLLGVGLGAAEAGGALCGAAAEGSTGQALALLASREGLLDEAREWSARPLDPPLFVLLPASPILVHPSEFI
jgi:hypothetical protein